MNIQVLNLSEAQAYIDKLAKKWKVPPIQAVEIIPSNGITEYFSDDPDWHIGVSSKTDAEDLKHEFGHYVIALLRLERGLEEAVAELFR